MTTRQVQVAATKSLFDELIDRHAEAYLEAYQETGKPGELCVKEFSSFEKSGTGKFYIGMVWTSDYEKPETKQMTIRSSQSLAKNKTVDLDLSVIETTHSFFPGQIIAFQAFPFQRDLLTVKNFLNPLKIAPRMKMINTDEKINLLISSGPYMSPDQEDWALIDKLIESIKTNNVTHAILLGPFVDMDNKHMAPYFETKWKLILSKLVDGLFEQKCQIFLVPSSKDVLNSKMSTNYFYPSPKIEFDSYLKEKSKPSCRITSVTNPAQIDLGGLYVDVTSADVLFHFNNCQSFINRGTTNPFTSMFRHIITHGIYPIYPPPANDIAIDYPKLENYLQLNRLGAHITILPTRFNTTVTNVEDRVFVAIGKCSAKKHAVLIELPKIESSEEEPIKSVALAEYTHRIIPLAIKGEPGSQSQQIKAAAGDEPMCTSPVVSQITPQTPQNASQEMSASG